MNIFIDGHTVEVTKSRGGSEWYTHPVRKTACVSVKRNFVLGYHSKQGRISRSNEIQKQFLDELKTDNLSIRIQYKEDGYLYSSNNLVMQFTFIFEEKDSSWGEQRLQELLDKVLTLQVK